MMIRLLYLWSISAVVTACGVVGLCAWEWDWADAEQEEFLHAPGAVERFRETAGQREGRGGEKASPLVAQAKALASLLNPPPVAEKTSEVLPFVPAGQERSRPVPAARLTGGTAHFKLRATSYYPDQPGRSMALIAEPGGVEGQERWVKEGAQIGHFVIHEIRRGMIVYADGEQLREMAVERGTACTSFVHKRALQRSDQRYKRLAWE